MSIQECEHHPLSNVFNLVSTSCVRMKKRTDSVVRSDRNGGGQRHLTQYHCKTWSDDLAVCATDCYCTYHTKKNFKSIYIIPTTPFFLFTYIHMQAHIQLYNYIYMHAYYIENLTVFPYSTIHCVILTL